MSTTANSSTEQPQQGGVGKIINDIGKDFETVKPLVQLSGFFNIPTGHIVIGAFGLAFACIVFGFLSEFLTATIGMLYPAYMSFKAIESKGDDDDQQWLTYWVVFSFFHVADGTLSIVFKFIPFYYPLKVLFYVYLFYPKTKGALTLYKLIVHPLLKKNEQRIDDAIEKGEQKLHQKLNF